MASLAPTCKLPRVRLLPPLGLGGCPDTQHLLRKLCTWLTGAREKPHFEAAAWQAPEAQVPRVHLQHMAQPPCDPPLAAQCKHFVRLPLQPLLQSLLDGQDLAGERLVQAAKHPAVCQLRSNRKAALAPWGLPQQQCVNQLALHSAEHVAHTHDPFCLHSVQLVRHRREKLFLCKRLRKLSDRTWQLQQLPCDCRPEGALHVTFPQRQLGPRNAECLWAHLEVHEQLLQPLPVLLPLRNPLLGTLQPRILPETSAQLELAQMGQCRGGPGHGRCQRAQALLLKALPAHAHAALSLCQHCASALHRRVLDPDLR
mmetsp:Transcript_88664/g.275930  ORF Transcript_88664/g.275930 Transcript_88664/m.275930 type:complete len:313 (-) Transcript_88664:382-1320(-)